MVHRSKIEQLLECNQKVFSIEDLAHIWSENDFVKVKELAGYYADNNRIFRIKNGLYSITEKPDILEVAQHLVSPSYVSYHTALGIHGINFQFYSDIHCISFRKRTIKVEGVVVMYHQVKPDILFNPIGIMAEKGYNIASPERAICDSLYLSPGLSFDNLNKINVDTLFEIALIYNNKNLIKTLQTYFPQ